MMPIIGNRCIAPLRKYAYCQYAFLLRSGQQIKNLDDEAAFNPKRKQQQSYQTALLPRLLASVKEDRVSRFETFTVVQYNNKILKSHSSGRHHGAVHHEGWRFGFGTTSRKSRAKN